MLQKFAKLLVSVQYIKNNYLVTISLSAPIFFFIYLVQISID